jgi:CO dehydrogenase/acetyl-CoA synthase gamma subunit (corrinoid Fe-S protein)
VIEQQFANIYPLTAQNVLEYLPNIDCGECGHSSCADFAEALVNTGHAGRRCSELSVRIASVLDCVIGFVPKPVPFNIMMETTPTGLIEVGKPTISSPVAVTGNFRETVRLLENCLNACGISVFLLVTDTKGYSIDNAVEEKRFSPFEILKTLTETEIGSLVNHRNVVVPGLARSLAGQIQQMTAWKTTVGPVSGLELPLFLVKDGLG